MGMLTREERDALEDVFMSIHSKKSMNHILKHISIFIQNTIKHAVLGIKMAKINNFLHFFTKKKKNLSK